MEEKETAPSSSSVGITLIAKWGKERIALERLPADTSIGEVKWLLCEKTAVLPKRQKLIGLSLKGRKGLPDDALVSNIKSKKKTASGGGVVDATGGEEVVHQFILMGTPEEQIFVDPQERDDLPDVIDDFDLDFNAGSEEWVQHVAKDQNLKKFTESTAVNIMHHPREGKPLLVLDLDHTLLDFSSSTLMRDTSTHRVGDGSAARMKRPYMDDFLTKAYRHFDLVVWSQTSWRWLETKLIELGMLTNPGYRFCFVLDKTSMFQITSAKRDGSSYEHHVKPLQIIWSKFPQWGSHNTVHLDDLSRNFALNVGSGLKVTGFYRKKSSSRRDAELVGLSRYLEMLATSGLNFDDVDFKCWMDVVSGQRPLEDSAEEKKKST